MWQNYEERWIKEESRLQAKRVQTFPDHFVSMFERSEVLFYTNIFSIWEWHAGTVDVRSLASDVINSEFRDEYPEPEIRRSVPLFRDMTNVPRFPTKLHSATAVATRFVDVYVFGAHDSYPDVRYRRSAYRPETCASRKTEEGDLIGARVRLPLGGGSDGSPRGDRGRSTWTLSPHPTLRTCRTDTGVPRDIPADRVIEIGPRISRWDLAPSWEIVEIDEIISY